VRNLSSPFQFLVSSFQLPVSIFIAPRTSPRLIARTCSRSKCRISPRTLFAPITHVDPLGLLPDGGPCSDFFYAVTHAQCGEIPRPRDDGGFRLGIEIGLGGGGGGGVLPAGGAPTPPPPAPFPWPLLLPGLFNSLDANSGGNGTGISKCVLMAPSYRGLGCIYLCKGPSGLAIAGKSCGPLDEKALRLCPFSASFLGPVLVSPPDFCGKTVP